MYHLRCFKSAEAGLYAIFEDSFSRSVVFQNLDGQRLHEKPLQKEQVVTYFRNL